MKIEFYRCPYCKGKMRTIEKNVVCLVGNCVSIPEEIYDILDMAMDYAQIKYAYLESIGYINDRIMAVFDRYRSKTKTQEQKLKEIDDEFNEIYDRYNL